MWPHLGLLGVCKQLFGPDHVPKAKSNQSQQKHCGTSTCTPSSFLYGCEYISVCFFVFFGRFFFVFRGRCSTLWTLECRVCQAQDFLWALKCRFRGRCSTLWPLACRFCGRRRTLWTLKCRFRGRCRTLWVWKCRVELVAGAGLCGPWSADFVAGARLCGP